MPPLVVHLVLNMYIKLVSHVSWNGISSKPCMVSNGVKQGTVISSILFYVYIDGLLMALQNAGYGCYIILVIFFWVHWRMPITLQSLLLLCCNAGNAQVV